MKYYCIFFLITGIFLGISAQINFFCTKWSEGTNIHGKNIQLVGKKVPVAGLMYKIDNNVGYIINLWSDKLPVHDGYMILLLQKGIKHMKELGLHKVIIEIAHEDHETCQFYKNQGFKREQLGLEFEEISFGFSYELDLKK